MVKPFTISLLVTVISNHLLFGAKSQRNAFANNTNTCLFDGWRTGLNPVLAHEVNCSGRERTGLCYGIEQQTAFFAVCFNKNTLIPEFTGHVVVPAFKRGGKRSGWKNENGRYAPNPQSSHEDYKTKKQVSIVPHLNVKKSLFYSRGHLVPNGDFATAQERKFTMVNTNIAPQWQPFNGGNWVKLEEAVRLYADNNKRRVFVFTGTGGASYLMNRNRTLLNNRVLVPKYFWKAVCDPEIGKSVVFVAANPTGMENNTLVGGCNLNGVYPPILQSTRLGILYCYSLNKLKSMNISSEFILPSFAATCKPEKRGEFLDQYVNRLQ